MSGFFGVLGAGGREISRELLQRSGRILRSRGSTAETIWIADGAGICTSRPADASSAQRAGSPTPLGANWLVGDVRLDARRELLQQLGAKGELLPPESCDQEILLHAWRVWGEGCLARLLGDFSFALYDAREKALWCGRDFIGARPFYYAQSDGFFYFTNTLNALRVVPEILADLDEGFVSDCLLRGFSPSTDRTVYSGIRRLPSGHVLRLQGKTLEVRPFLRLPIEEPLRLSRPEEYVEAYRELLKQAVEDRLPGGPAALYLSGGLDSATVCAVAAGLAASGGTKASLKAFTVSWRPLLDDPEPDFGRLTAEHLGLQQEILGGGDFTPFTPLEPGQLPAPEPGAGPFFARAQGHYRRIAMHSPVILSGDGGDDVLLGEAGPYFQGLWAAGDWFEIVRSLGGFVWDHGRLPPLRMGLRHALRTWTPFARGREKFPNWFEPDFARRARLAERWEAISEHAPALGAHPVHPVAYASLHSGFWARILEDEDAGVTQVPLETRAPLLDLRVLRFLLRLPPVPWCADKELLRRAMRGTLPESVRTRRKTPLQEDPLEAVVEQNVWIPTAPETPPAAVRNYIDWTKWVATLCGKRGSYGRADLFPLELVLWLKDIENGRWIE